MTRDPDAILSQAQVWSPLPAEAHVEFWTDGLGETMRADLLTLYRSTGLLIRGTWLGVTAERLRGDTVDLAGRRGVRLTPREQREAEGEQAIERLLEMA